MSEYYKKFLKDSEQVAFDTFHREKINNTIEKYNIAVRSGKRQYENLDLAKNRAAGIKHKVLENLDKYLYEFELNFENNGGRIIWAPSASDALKAIVAILKKNKAKLVVKSKSMITEELELNKVLENESIETLETDLGEFIVQVANEKPYHIVTPAMHKSKEEVAELFSEKFGIDKSSTPEQISAFVREKLRDKFINADVGITGVNFLIAETGSLVLTENEGNGVLTSSIPKIHIAISGIEKIIPTLRDLDLFLPLLAVHGTGQNITAYNSIISGPKQNDETDGPEELYLVLLDNRRTEILKHKELRRSLSCIRCGACLNACPVYKNVGGYTYNSTYTGPIGAIITPHLRGMNEFGHLSFASTLCGKCTEVCPVNINLHELLLINRQELVKFGIVSKKERQAQKWTYRVLKKRKRMEIANATLKNRAINLLFKKTWGPRRTLPVFAEKSFNKIWEEKNKEKNKR